MPTPELVPEQERSSSLLVPATTAAYEAEVVFRDFPGLLLVPSLREGQLPRHLVLCLNFAHMEHGIGFELGVNFF